MTNHLPETVTLREVYQLVEGVRKELLAEIAKVEVLLDSKLTIHASQHETESNHRSSLIRWAVTSILSSAGVAVAIYLALRPS